MQLDEYPAEITQLRTQVMETDQRINDIKTELQRQLEDSTALKDLQIKKEKLYIQLEKTRNEFSISKMEFMKRDREPAQ